MPRPIPQRSAFLTSGNSGASERARSSRAFALLKSIGSTLPNAVSQTAVLLGSPNEALPAFCHEEQAELLVVGSRGRGRLAAALLGSVSARHASAGTCPVVVVPPDAANRFQAPRATGGSVICGVDGSVESVRALRVAAKVAEQLEPELVPVYFDQRHSWNRTPAADTIRLCVQAGNPVAGLRRRAVSAEGRLIVVGSRGRGALTGALLGSVSRALASSAPVPVLVVPPNARLGERATARSHASQPSALGDGVAAAAMSVVGLIDVDGRVDQAGRRC